MERILIVEDEQPMRELIGFYLRHYGFAAESASDAAEALSMLDRYAYDLLVVDWMLPGLDGRELCRRIREFSSVPILMLTARNRLDDKIEGFDAGIDDYLTKPFEEAEFIARIKALLRRAQSPVSATSRVLFHRGLSVDPEKREAVYRNTIIPLTAHEFTLLLFLLRHKGQALTRDQIIENVWGYDFAGDDRTIDSHIRNLRAKLKKAGIDEAIQTVWGVGYKLS